MHRITGNSKWACSRCSKLLAISLFILGAVFSCKDDIGRKRVISDSSSGAIALVVDSLAWSPADEAGIGCFFWDENAKPIFSSLERVGYTRINGELQRLPLVKSQDSALHDSVSKIDEVYENGAFKVILQLTETGKYDGGNKYEGKMRIMDRGGKIITLYIAGICGC